MITCNPTQGMGVTIQYHTDRQPGTIIDITHNGKRIVIQEDSVNRIDNNGMSESQEYTYHNNPDGAIHVATLRADGSWRLMGEKTTVYLGYRDRYYDFSF